MKILACAALFLLVTQSAFCQEEYKLLSIDTATFNDYTLLYFQREADTFKVLSSNILDNADTFLFRLRTGNVYELNLYGKTKTPNKNHPPFQADDVNYMVGNKIILKNNEYFFYAMNVKKYHYVIAKCPAQRSQ